MMSDSVVVIICNGSFVESYQYVPRVSEGLYCTRCEQRQLRVQRRLHHANTSPPCQAAKESRATTVYSGGDGGRW